MRTSARRLDDASTGVDSPSGNGIMRTLMRVSSVLLLACLVSHATASAQALTGALVGTVKDEQGGVLAGAVVRISSASLIGGSPTSTTNDVGQLRFPVLPPGTYCDRHRVVGICALSRGGLSIGAGSHSRANGLSCSWPASRNRLSSRDPARASRRGAADSKPASAPSTSRPSRRDGSACSTSIRAAPGVSPTSPSSGTVNTVSAFGSGGNENLFLIDGTNFTCPCAGVSRAEPSVDVIQEVQVQSVGASAEFGNIQGAVFNVVTRQGSDRFVYDASYYGQPSGLTSQPVVLPFPGRPSPSGYERARYRDFTTNLGGPVVRDRLWFFTGYQYLRDYDSQPGTDPELPEDLRAGQDLREAHVAAHAGPAAGAELSRRVLGQPRSADLRHAVRSDHARPHASVPAMTFGDLTHTLSPNTVWDVRVGRFVYSRRRRPEHRRS